MSTGGPVVVVDCDPGIDDALALLALAELARRGAVRVAGVTTVAGNAPVELTSRNAAFVLAGSALRGTPVRAGGGVGAPGSPRHGPDGLGGVSTSTSVPGWARAGEAAAERWSDGGALELARQLGHGDATILALGPLTNLAGALALAAPGSGARVVAMGGSIAPAANPGEFNFAHDAPAAARVLGSGLAVTAVPIDVTRRVRFPRSVVEAIGREAPNRLVGALLAASLERHHGDHCHVHDAVALVVLAHPGLARTVRGRVSPTPAGMVTVEPDRHGTCEVVVELEAGAAARLLTELWLASPPGSPALSPAGARG